MHWGFPPTIGGVETHLSILLPQLVKQGHQVALLTGAFLEEKAHDHFHGVEIFRTPLFDLNWLVKRGLDGLVSDLNRLYLERIGPFAPDIIHTHNMHYFSEPHIKVLNDICQEMNVPLLLTAHNVWDDALFLTLTREVNWSHIIAVSHYIRMEILGVGIDDAMTTTIHHGLDLSKYSLRGKTNKALRKYPQLKNKKIIFHPARMGLAKGCDVTIKAMRTVLEHVPDAMLVLAGSKNIIDWEVSQEKDIAYFIELIRALGITDNVLIDVFALEEMPDMYKVSDVVVYPSSVSEPFGLTMLEAFASARPIIVTRMGGMPEVVQDGLSGYVIPPRDFEALSNRIVLLLDNARLRRRLGDTGRNIVEQHYTKEIMTKSHLNVYTKVLQDRAESYQSKHRVKKPKSRKQRT